MNPLRLVGLLFGLVSAAVILIGTAFATRSVTHYLAQTPLDAAPEPVPATAEAAPATEGRSSAVLVTRVVLGAVGVGVLVVGVWKVLHAVHPENYLWLLLWLAAAVVLHDGVLDPLITLVRSASHRGLRRFPDAALTVVKGGLVLGGLLVLVVVPMVYAKHLGPLNPTILPGDYGARLVASLVVIAVFTALAAALVAVRARKRSRAQPRPQSPSVELAQG
ncbi:hypothetical protein SAMN04488544_0067 [Microlunatus sagamiharensis]|uniref:Uncharacterized protein n=1 Tax=Microlunatus sagamiharensis TaxID=546874 RepID=A0A1H2LG37_9ACTN|nr:hypothetical protein [Microlunatus sagamiharensis]SDU79879.1 hypothetical protein SAMN04488544_0067 [Microlunatus sagamiharensis]